MSSMVTWWLQAQHDLQRMRQEVTRPRSTRFIPSLPKEGNGPLCFLRGVDDLIKDETAMQNFFEKSPFIAYCKTKDATNVHYFDKEDVSKKTLEELLMSWFRTSTFVLGDARVVKYFFSGSWVSCLGKPIDVVSCMRNIELLVYDAPKELDTGNKTRPTNPNNLLVGCEQIELNIAITIISRMSFHRTPQRDQSDRDA
ncbi:hypothetical protein BU23DRAFT_572316 [Bimuria novae-zelandiae CBS 107.79]|uniref:Uncharacterized protein n=1 Tax=Bimuria novae-zelandiae CBS 107.79 TaxID=1447943 RepID=A0A6A5UXP8_9PLEO|nr:hypothetical protein BU23DRAFT_572316 [Bimuria novae-zelandiae CBS 107.79]